MRIGCDNEPTAEALAHALEAKRSGVHWMARCPAHEDRTPSLSISRGRNGRTLVLCHAHCPQTAVLDALRDRNLWPPPKTNGRDRMNGSRRIVATYEYLDEAGTLLYQVCRYAPKDFRQRRTPGPDDPPHKIRDGWVWSVQGVRVVPYKLPELLEAIANQHPVYIVEGEKDTDNLTKLNIAATCNAGGVGKWRHEHALFLTGADVILIPDNDDAGRVHMQAVARSLAGIANRIRVVDLPNLPAKGDVSDWIAAGGTAERLWNLTEDRQDWQPDGSTVDPEEEPSTREISDSALARGFAKLHENNLRFVAFWGRWMRFDGERWVVDETRHAFDLVHDYCRDAAARTPVEKKRDQLKAARKVAAVHTLAQADRRLAAAADAWDPDVDVFNEERRKDLVATINLATGERSKPRPQDYITKTAGTHSDPNMPTPLWTAFLQRVTHGDGELQAYLQRVCGYCLTGRIQEHVLFFLYGTGANGKTVFINTISGIMGEYAITAPMDLFMATRNEQHPTGLAYLRAARLVVATETDAGERWSEAKIKRLTGGDKITARFMRGDFFEYAPQFKIMIAGNHVPALRTVDEAMRRRIHLIPFTVTIPPEQRDKHLPEKLKAEWPGILAWCVAGCALWRARGLAPPTAVTAATAAYLQAEDSFAQWLDECCERKDFALETTDELYASFKAWLEKAGEVPPSMKRFSMMMAEHKFEKDLHPKTRKSCFKGVRLLRPNYTEDPRSGRWLSLSAKGFEGICLFWTYSSNGFPAPLMSISIHSFETLLYIHKGNPFGSLRPSGNRDFCSAP